MVDEHETLSRSPNRSRVSYSRNYKPRNDEASILSSRGQSLPQLISSRSGTNVHALREQSSPRRASTFAIGRRLSGPSLYDEYSDIEYGSGTPALSGGDHDERRASVAANLLNTPQMRSQRLIGNSNPRYKWEQYFKADDELKQMKKSVRKYYERNNYLIQRYLYIDRLLDSSLPHNLIQEYNNPSSPGFHVPPTISEVETPPATPLLNGSAKHPENNSASASTTSLPAAGASQAAVKVKRTPKNLYKVPDEDTPLLCAQSSPESTPQPVMPEFVPEEEASSDAPIVTVAIYINLVANTILLIMKIIVTVLTSSVSVLASLVDAALDFLSTGIVWTTTRLISRQDQYAYPVGRRRLEPIGVLVFSVIMVTSFFQVALEGISRLTGEEHEIVALSVPAIAIMGSTVVIKFACWLWCRLIKNSSVQALAQDAMTDVVFNIFSIIFPLVGYFAQLWWLDSVGGILLSVYVILSWSRTSVIHIRNLTGYSADADERNVLLYLTMRFAKTIRQIQGLQAYHAGDKLIVEADVVVGYPADGQEGIRGGKSENGKEMSLRDSHDLGESLQYMLESVPMVDRAFVHLDYESYNLPSHMAQQD
ncbi:MAG: hypothetical protein M1820_010330 [Bogoriella megaspora]|nr:MAG: hypothetical protein M1820_010330 [Bogoriella megaspora]